MHFRWEHSRGRQKLARPPGQLGGFLTFTDTRQIERVYVYCQPNLVWNSGCAKELPGRLGASLTRAPPASRRPPRPARSRRSRSSPSARSSRAAPGASERGEAEEPNDPMRIFRIQCLHMIYLPRQPAHVRPHAANLRAERPANPRKPLQQERR